MRHEHACRYRGPGDACQRQRSPHHRSDRHYTRAAHCAQRISCRADALKACQSRQRARREVELTLDGDRLGDTAHRCCDLSRSPSVTTARRLAGGSSEPACPTVRSATCRGSTASPRAAPGAARPFPCSSRPKARSASRRTFSRGVIDTHRHQHRLFPAEPSEREQVESLCARFDDELGPKARRLMYVHLLADRPLVLRFNNAGVPAWEDRALRIGWPLIRPRPRVARSTSHPGVEKRRREPPSGASSISSPELLEDGRPFLLRSTLHRGRSDVRIAVGGGDRSAGLRRRAAAARADAAQDRRARGACPGAPGRLVCAVAVQPAGGTRARVPPESRATALAWR